MVARELAVAVAELLADHPARCGDPEPGEFRGRLVQWAGPESRDAFQEFAAAISDDVDDDVTAVVEGVAEVELQDRLVFDAPDLAAVTRDENEGTAAFGLILHPVAE